MLGLAWCCSVIKRFCEDPTPYLEERLKLKELFHEFDDGRNCERVAAAIKELLSGLKDHNSEFACETPVRTDQRCPNDLVGVHSEKALLTKLWKYDFFRSCICGKSCSYMPALMLFA